MQRQAEERNRKEVEALKEADKLAAYTLVVKETQRKSREACETEAETLSKVNRDNRTVEDLIKLGQKLKEAMGMKMKIQQIVNQKVENRIGCKKQVGNGKILKTVSIGVACVNLIDGKGKAKLERVVGETTKLLAVFT